MKSLLTIILFLSGVLTAEPLKIKVAAKNAILINAATGQILFEKQPYDQVYPASLTKIATCLYALKQQNHDLNKFVSCPHHCLRKMNKSVKIAHSYKDPPYLLEPDGTHFWIKPGEELTFKDLLYGLMIASGNDAANFLAYHVGGNIPTFVKNLNSYLKDIGCEGTNFVNPHGLHHPHHYSNAFDLSILVKEAFKEDLIRNIVSTKEYERNETNLQPAKKIQQSNLLLQPGKFFYPRAVGMKTGYTSDAGYCLASVAQDEKRTLIAILLGGETPNSRYQDAIHLFDAAFQEEKVKRLLFNKRENTFSREVKKGREHLQATLTKDIVISYYPAEEPKITIELNWDHQNPPIKEGSYVGTIGVLDSKGKVLESSPLIAIQNVEKSYGAILADTIKGNIEYSYNFQNLLFFFLVIGVGLFCYYIYRVQKHS